jgi:hypothetical protein
LPQRGRSSLIYRIGIPGRSYWKKEKGALDDHTIGEREKDAEYGRERKVQVQGGGCRVQGGGCGGCSREEKRREGSETSKI